MDRQAAAKERYDGLKKALTDDRKVRKKTRRTRVFGLAIVGAWVIVPALLFEVDVDAAAAPEFFRQPTAHEAFLLELVRGGGLEGAGEAELAREWEAGSYRAIDSPVTIGSSYQEFGVFPSDDPQALGLRVRVPEGQRLRLSVEGRDTELPALFVDVFRAAPDSLIPPGSTAEPRPAFLVAGEMDDGRWHFDAERAGDYVFRVQPELGEEAQYRLAIQVGARWMFPVAGAGEDDIGGVFGDPRDGGDREHHGVDIFKPRGTPVLAASDGRVTSVDTTEIGGRVVWLREGDGGRSIYYAHLETPLVRDGQRLQAGDTVGLVGNTGNARSTPPHLHFGVYQRGPVDPWDLILPIPPSLPSVWVSLDALGQEGQVANGGASLLGAPRSSGAVLAELTSEMSVRVLAGAGGWYRVVLPGDEVGYVEGGRLTLPNPNGTEPSGFP